MVIQIDKKYDEMTVRQFASQKARIPDNWRAFFEETFSGEHSTEFYEGLLSAYANMYVLTKGMDRQELIDTSGALVAFVADELRKKYDS